MQHPVRFEIMDPENVLGHGLDGVSLCRDESYEFIRHHPEGTLHYTIDYRDNAISIT